MGPEDRLARLLASLDRLPRGARRALTVLLPLALLGALVASLIFAPSNRDHEAKPVAGHRRHRRVRRRRRRRRRRGSRIRRRRSAATSVAGR